MKCFWCVAADAGMTGGEASDSQGEVGSMQLQGSGANHASRGGAHALCPRIASTRSLCQH